MRSIVSKNVTALYPGGQLLQDEYFRSIRNLLKKDDRYTQKEESGAPKKTVTESLGLGSNDRGHNPGAGMGLGRDENESKNRSVSSGYNDAEQPDDETGPGYSKTPNSPYYGQDVFNELFLDLSLKSQGHNDSIRGHLKKILHGTPMVKPHRRHSVDNLN